MGGRVRAEREGGGARSLGFWGTAMASRVGLACDERMGKTHEGEFVRCREEPSRITSISQSLKSAGIPERCCFTHPYACHTMMMMMLFFTL